MIDPRIYNALLNIQASLNELAVDIRISGLNARREKLTRQQASHELELLADRIDKISHILEVMYGREERIDE